MQHCLRGNSSFRQLSRNSELNLRNQVFLFRMPKIEKVELKDKMWKYIFHRSSYILFWSKSFFLLIFYLTTSVLIFEMSLWCHIFCTCWWWFWQCAWVHSVPLLFIYIPFLIDIFQQLGHAVMALGIMQPQAFDQILTFILFRSESLSHLPTGLTWNVSD